jgi:hypothetical protein
MLGDGMDAPGRVHIVVRHHGWSRSVHHGAAPLTTKLSGHALAADHAFEGVTVDRRHDPIARLPVLSVGDAQAADFAEGGTRLFHLTVAPKGSRLDYAICDRRRGNRHQNSHAQRRSVRTPDARSQGDQSRSVGSLDGKSRRGTRSSGIRQIRRKLRQAIPSPMDNTGHTPGNTLENNRGNTLENDKHSLASERGWLPISCRQQ